MKVLLITGTICRGGLEVVIRTLADGLNDRGISADVFSFTDVGKDELFADFDQSHLFFANKLSLTSLLCRYYDVVHATSLSVGAGVFSAVSRSRHKGPVIVTCHGSFVKHPDFYLAHQMTAVSNGTAERIHGMVPDPIKVIHNGIDSSIFCPKCSSAESSRPIISWVGRAHDSNKNFKGFMQLVQIMQNDPVEFLIVSADRDESCLYFNNELSSRVTVKRHLDHRKLSEVYRQVAKSRGCLVSTSISEGLPLVLIEAMACGCLVVAPAIGGIPEIIINKETGLLYSPETSIRDIRLLILEYINKSDIQTYITNKAIEYVKSNHTSDVMVNKYIMLYEDILRNHANNYSIVDQLYRSAIPLAGKMKQVLGLRQKL